MKLTSVKCRICSFFFGTWRDHCPVCGCYASHDTYIVDRWLYTPFNYANGRIMGRGLPIPINELVLDRVISKAN